MKKVVIVLSVCFLLIFTSTAYAGMGFTPDMILNMLEMAYDDSESISYDFLYDEETNAYFCIVTEKDILVIANACKSGYVAMSHWDGIMSSMLGIDSSVSKLIGTLSDDTEYELSSFLHDKDDENATIALISDGVLLYDAVNGVPTEVQND